MEDYDYIDILREMDPAAAAAAVGRISAGTGASLVERNTTLLREVREAVAAAIEKGLAGSTAAS
jgi:hypothetical protein